MTDPAATPVKTVTANSRNSAALPALVYIVSCGVYIYLSGILAVRIARDAEHLQRIETAKGLLFILVTGALFYFLNLRQWRKLRQLEERIRDRETALVLTNRRAAAAMSVASLAHDLNNLLQMLEGSLMDLKPFAEENPESEQLYRELMKNKEALFRFTRRIQEHASTEESLGAMKMIDISAELGEVLELSQRHPDLRKCQVNFEAPRKLKLKVNATLLEEAVHNLLINAAQSAPRAGGKIKLVLRTRKNQACIEVHDNGPGVPAEERNRIFEPCYTTKPNGSGLGMLAVKAFAMHSGGGIEISESSLGGACFTLYFPIRTESGPATR